MGPVSRELPTCSRQHRCKLMRHQKRFNSHAKLKLALNRLRALVGTSIAGVQAYQGQHK